MSGFVDLTNQVFERLRVLSRAPNRGTMTMWHVLCDPDHGGCGTAKVVNGYKLRTGNTQSCGCLYREMKHIRSTHGHARKGKTSAEYTSWAGMIDRCYRAASKKFHHYGGRGIRVCDRWHSSFENFLADMGPKPSPKHSLDRIDVNGNYEPGNCRWATQSQQMRNSRVTRMVTVNGETKPAADWGDETGIKYKTIVDRIDHGIAPEVAVAFERYGMLDRKRYEHNGESKTLEEWAAAIGATKSIIYQRLRKGWTIAEALTPPIPGGRVRRANLPAPEPVPLLGAPANDTAAPAAERESA